MPGAMNKQNQRQSQKRKQRNKRYGFKRIRITEIPLHCTECSHYVVVSSQQAYKEGGNPCVKCGNKLSFSVRNFPKPQVVKK